MKRCAGPFSTGWEHPVDSGPPSTVARGHVRFAGQVLRSSEAVPSMEGTLGAADYSPRRGGGRDAVLQAERPAQAGREASVGSKTARKRPVALASPASVPTSSRQKVPE